MNKKIILYAAIGAAYGIAASLGSIPDFIGPMLPEDGSNPLSNRTLVYAAIGAGVGYFMK